MIKHTFDFEIAKPYIISSFIIFHILPLLLILSGIGVDAGLGYMLVMLCPICEFVISFLYGMKNGFNFKMPAVMTGIFALSVFMYYHDYDTMYLIGLALVSTVINSIVCMVVTLLGICIGSYLKKYI